MLVVSIIRSIGAGIQTPAVNAVIPQLVPEEHLMRYNGIYATVQSIVQFAAPAVAGAILSIGTFRATLFIDILTAFIVIGLLSCILLPKQKVSNKNVSVLSEIKSGFRYLFSDCQPGLWRYLLVSDCNHNHHTGKCREHYAWYRSWFSDCLLTSKIQMILESSQLLQYSLTLSIMCTDLKSTLTIKQIITKKQSCSLAYLEEY